MFVCSPHACSRGCAGIIPQSEDMLDLHRNIEETESSPSVFDVTRVSFETRVMHEGTFPVMDTNPRWFGKHAQLILFN